MEGLKISYCANDAADTNECPICLGYLLTEDITRMVCCKQEMHARCYIQCMSLARVCPLCRNTDEHRITIHDCVDIVTDGNANADADNIGDRADRAEPVPTQQSCSPERMFALFSSALIMFIVFISIRHTP